MKTQINRRCGSHLDNYCRLYGVTMPELDPIQTHYFVAFSGEGVRVLYLHKPSELLGRIVCGAMKRGTVLYVHNGWIKPLTWETWKRTWAKLFDPKPRKTKALVPNREPAYRSEIFEAMQAVRPYRKPRKQGFERTHIANTSMNLLG